MRTIKRYNNKIKMEFYFNMARLGLNMAHKHMGDAKFWRYMRLFRKYHQKYCELYSTVEL